MTSKRVSDNHANALSKKLKVDEQSIDLTKEDAKYPSDCEIVNDPIQVDSQHEKWKVDFITRVPYDVLCKIASYFDTETLDQCINVNLAWRNEISQCPAFWQRVELRGDKRSSVLYILPKVAHHTRDLKICMLQDSVAKILGVMEMGYFSNLQSLDITLSSPEQIQLLQESRRRDRFGMTVGTKKASLAVYGELCRFLPYVAGTLTKLNLWLCNYRNAPSLSKILSICRNLEDLTYECHSTSAFTDLRMPYTTLLTSVSLSPGISGVISQENLKGLVQCSPKIRWLSVEGCPYDALSIIHQFPLQLDYLAINCDYGNLHMPPDLNSYTLGEYQGLRYLIMMDKEKPSKTLLPFLETHRCSIQELYLSGINRYVQLGHDDSDSDDDYYDVFEDDFDDYDEDNSNDDSNDNGSSNGVDSDALRDFPIMTNLKTLYIRSSHGTDYWKATPRILHGCPNLDTLKIEDQWGSCANVPNHLVDAVTGVTTFSTLKLLDAHLDSSSMRRLLENYSARHSDKSPSDLEFYYCNIGQRNKSGIMSVPFIRSLKALRLYGLLPDLQPDISIIKLCQALRDMPRLEYIHIGGHQREYISDKGLQLLSQIKSLRTVQLENVDNEYYTEKGVAMLRERVPPIQLELYNWCKSNFG